MVAGSGQDDGAHRRVPVGDVERLPQVTKHLVAQRISALRRVEADDRDAVVEAVVDLLVGRRHDDGPPALSPLTPAAADQRLSGDVARLGAHSRYTAPAASSTSPPRPEGDLDVDSLVHRRVDPDLDLAAVDVDGLLSVVTAVSRVLITP